MVCVGSVNREAGQLVPARLSLRVGGDGAYCVIALNSKLKTLSLFQQQQNMQALSPKP